MDFLTKISKNILSGAGYMTSFAKGLLTKTINYQDVASVPTAQAEEPTYQYKANPVPEDMRSAFDLGYKYYPQDLKKGELETIAMMESSMFTNEKNKGANFVYGKEGWRMGLDKGGHFEDIVKSHKENPNLRYEALQRNKEGVYDIEGILDVSTPTAGIMGGAAALARARRYNPELSLEDLYFKIYNTKEESDTPERRQAFRDYIKQYSSIK